MAGPLRSAWSTPGSGRPAGARRRHEPACRRHAANHVPIPGKRHEHDPPHHGAGARPLPGRAANRDRRREVPLFGGVWAIFGHGNVAGMGEALHAARDELPTFRAHNEQAMAHAAIAFAKASRRRRMMACTTSIGPGATNMVTAAAVAHVNRLPLLLLPGDVFASRRPDPVLQQVEDFGDGTVSANDCFRPVSRYFDRIARPEQIIPALPAGHGGSHRPGRMRARDAGLLPGRPGRGLRLPGELLRGAALDAARASAPDERELAEAVSPPEGCQEAADRRRRRRALFATPSTTLARLRRDARHSGRRDAGRQVARSPDDHPPSWARSASPARARPTRSPRRPTWSSRVGTRLQDFTTGSWALFKNPDRSIIGLNIAGLRRRASIARCRWSAMRVRRSRSSTGAGRLEGAVAPGREARRRARRRAWIEDCGALHRTRPMPTCLRRPGDRRRQRSARAHRRRRLRGGRPAGRTAQAVEARRGPAATTWNTAIPAWATRSPAASA